MTTPTDKSFIPSPQQAAVIDWVRTGSGSAFIEAVAGSGKTTTLIEALKKTRGTVAFAAYNKKIVAEIKEKTAALNLGNQVKVGTFHSFGLNAWRRVYPSVKVDDKLKTQKTIEKFREIKIPRRLDAFVLKLVSLAKQRGLGLFGDISDRSLWHEIVDHFDLQYELETDSDAVDYADDDQGEVSVEAGIEMAIRTLKYHQQLSSKLIDFDDMIYMPAITGIKIWQNDWVFVDEAQDTNPARRALARKMMKTGGRSVWVGDRHQAIYGFTGADSDAVDQIINDFGCVQLPLTVTYRCPKSVVASSQQFVSHIQAHESAPDGSVIEMMTADFSKADHLKTLTAHDAVLCRNTKPLVSMAYVMIRHGVACHVEGRDIGMGLVKLVNRYRVKSLDDLRDRLENFMEREVAKLIAKGKETQAEAVHDRVETIFTIMDSEPVAQSVEDLRRKIMSLFVDSDESAESAEKVKPTLTMSTVHKAKGREWGKVFILGWNTLMPSKWARQAWQKEQETNLQYVAVTRAKSDLVFINGVK
jgi:DNA helicase-2/ATP-dependent DNA helicase PcrA